MSTFNRFRRYSDDAYEFKRGHLGHAYIFSNDKFRKKGYGERKGNEKDVQALERTLSELGFAGKTEVFENYSQGECLEKLTEIAHGDSLDDSCMMMFFLSHGNLNEVQMQDYEITTKNILERFDEEECRYLKNKPKVFVFQACRGHERNEVFADQCEHADAERCNDHEEMETVDESSDNSGPKGADLLLCFATSPGFVSYRSEQHGSRFIQTFCNVLMDYMHSNEDNRHDFVSLMTIVAKEVADMTSFSSLQFKKKEEESDKKVLQRQMPWLSSTLRKKIYFETKYERRRNIHPDEDEE